MKSSSQVIGLPLVGVKEGTECGIVRDIMIDPETKKIKAVVVRGQKGDYDHRELKISDIMGIGKDYMITRSIENAVSIHVEGSGKTLLKLKCIASSGDILGNIQDFVFDEKTGEIQLIQLDTGLEVPGDSILSLANNLMFLNYDANGPIGVSALEKEQQEYMIGRTVKKDIKAEDGSIVVKKGTIVTEAVIRQAEEAGVIVDLTLEL